MKDQIIYLAISLLMPFLSMAQQWPEAGPEARPGTRWWWLGSAVDSININYNIDEYAKAGLGAVEITPIYGVQGNEANEIPYLSEEWMKALREVQDASKRNNVLVDMNLGTGWPFGGPEITIEEAACKVVSLVDTVTPGGIPVKAIPEKDKDIAKEIASSRRILPDGREEVIRLFESRTRQAVKRAAPGGQGMVMDHFDRNAVGKYLDKFSNAFDTTGTPYPHNFFNDSYEVYRANWTPSLFEEFEQRRGYKLQERLPELLGLVDDNNTTLADYRLTLSELLLENFTSQWTDWAHRHGVQTRNQAHGSPANLIDLYAAVDVPEIESFGLTNLGIKGLRKEERKFIRFDETDITTLKYAPSAAHITGKPLVSCETFTWLTEHFRSSLSQMKPDLDLLFSSGINHVFYHGTAYSPKDDPWPGWKFYASIDMSPTNTIWRDAPFLNEYITRCQSFLQWGQPDNDYLVYLPIRDIFRKRLLPGDDGLLLTFEIHKMDQRVPEFIRDVLEIDSLGYDFDYISDRYLLSTGFRDGMLETAAGIRYHGLIIPGSGEMSAAAKEHLDSLEKAGAVIIRGIDHEAIKHGAESESLRTDHNLRILRRRNPDGYHYFMANLTPEDVEAPVRLAVDFADAAWFDPLTGEIYRADVKDGELEVNLRSGESRILCTYNKKTSLPSCAARMSIKDTIDLGNRPWELTFIESYPEIKTKYNLDSLRPWTCLGSDELNDLAGTGVYGTSFNIDKQDLDGEWHIDLGDVRESARVYLNGKFLGCAWSVPFTLKCGDALKAGANELRIEVTNLGANRIRALDRKGTKWRKFKEINVVDVNYKKTTYEDWETMPSGINNTVKLIRSCSN